MAAVPDRSWRWRWAGRALFAVIVVGLVVYLARVGWDQADKRASSIGAVLALLALGAPYLLPSTGGGVVLAEPERVEDSGTAEATGGGRANTGVDSVDGAERPARVVRSGDARADGPGSVANTGIVRRPRP
ncbi:hypothetical protein LQ51_30460 [Micromonospora sp. HK10]|nr:hypothetical protein LQ51_30460 [Micromonospora sp. HK10]